MVSYKLINGRFEKQADLISADYSFESFTDFVSYFLRDISPLRDGLAVITTLQGLAVIRAKDAKLTANTLTMQEMQDQLIDVVSEFSPITYEVSTVSQFDKLGDVFSSQILQIGIMIYNRPEDNQIMISSLETGLKLIEFVTTPPVAPPA